MAKFRADRSHPRGVNGRSKKRKNERTNERMRCRKLSGGRRSRIAIDGYKIDAVISDAPDAPLRPAAFWSASEKLPQWSMMLATEDHLLLMSSQLRQRLQPAAIMASHSLVLSSLPRYAGQLHAEGSASGLQWQQRRRVLGCAAEDRDRAARRVCVRRAALQLEISGWPRLGHGSAIRGHDSAGSAVDGQTRCGGERWLRCRILRGGLQQTGREARCAEA